MLGENLAKGRVAVMIGLTYYSLLPFIKAGLPVKPVPTLKEGTYGTGGSGNLAIIMALRIRTLRRFLLTGYFRGKDRISFRESWGRRRDAWTWIPNGSVRPA